MGVPLEVPRDHDRRHAFASDVWTNYMSSKRERQDRDLQWWTAHQWAIGNTEVFFDGYGRGRGQVYAVRSGDRRSRRIRPLNLGGVAIDGIVGKDVRSRPTFGVSPTTDDDSDRLAARASRDWLKWLWDKEGLTGKRRQISMERAITGNVFAKPYFNELGPPFIDEPVLCEVCQGRGVLMVQELGQPFQCPQCKGNGQGKSRRRPLGDVEIMWIPPWEIFPFSGSLSVEKSTGIIHSYLMSREAAAARYGVDPNELVPSEHGGNDEPEFESFIRTYHDFDTSGRNVRILEQYQPPLPGEEHPRLTIVAGGEQVFPRDGSPWGRMTEPYGRIPIVHFKWRQTPSQFFAEGYMLDAIPSLDTVNRVRSLIHRQALTMSHDKWFHQAGTVNVEQLRNVEAEVVEYFGNDPPKRQPGSPMPEYVHRFLEMEKDHIYELAHLHDLDRGIAPANIEAAQALSILAEQSDTARAGMHVEDEASWAVLAKMCLICAKANYGGEARFVRVVGDGGSYEVKKFMSSDFSNNIDVRVDLGSALSHSLALKRAEIINAWNAGMFENGGGEEAMRLMEFGLQSDLDNTDRLQESAAVQECDHIKQGKPHSFDPVIDDHNLHFLTHMRAALIEKIAGRLPQAQALAQAAMQHHQALGQLQAGQVPQGSQPHGQATPPPPPPDGRMPPTPEM